MLEVVILFIAGPRLHLIDNHIQDIIRQTPQFSRRPQQTTPVLTRVLNHNSVTALEFVGKLTLGGRITLR